MSFQSFISQKTAQAKQGVQKAADTVRLRTERNRLNDDLYELFDALGRLRFTELTEGADNSKESAGLVEEIQRVQEEISAVEEELKKLSSKAFCSQCGNEVPKNAIFCPDCGARLKDGAEEERSEE